MSDEAKLDSAIKLAGNFTAITEPKFKLRHPPLPVGYYLDALVGQEPLRVERSETSSSSQKMGKQKALELIAEKV